MFSTKQEAHALVLKIGEHFPLLLGSLEGIGYKAIFLYMRKGTSYVRKYAMSSILYIYLRKQSIYMYINITLHPIPSKLLLF
jgi:hypothetical protein